MPVIVRSVMPFSKRLPAGMCALQPLIVPGLLAKRALPSVRHVQEPHQTIVLSALPAHIRSTAPVCKRTAAVFARIHLLLLITSNMSVTVSSLLLWSLVSLNWPSQVVVQSALLVKYRISVLHR